jgi:hypothetical protein
VQMLVLSETGHAMPGIPILAVLATPFVLLALFGIGRVWLEEPGVRIINKGRTFLVAWEDIDHFTLGRHGLVRRVGIAALRDGRRVPIWGIQGPNAATRRDDIAAERLIAAMNAELERRRTREERELEVAELEEQYLVA